MHLSYHCGCFSLSETAASGHQTEPDTAPGHWLKQSQLRSLCWVWVSLYSHFPLYLMAHWAGVFSLHPLMFSILTSSVSHPEPIIRLRTWPQPQSPQPYAWNISSTGVLGSQFILSAGHASSFSFLLSCLLLSYFHYSAFPFVNLKSYISIIFMVTLKITTWVYKLPMFSVGQYHPLLGNMRPENTTLLTPWNYMLLCILVLHLGPNRKLFNVPLSPPSLWPSLCCSLLFVSGTQQGHFPCLS